MSEIRQTFCCGVHDFTGMWPTGLETLKAFCQQRYFPANYEDTSWSENHQNRTLKQNQNRFKGAFVIFTDIQSPGYKRDIEFAKTIRKLKLGKLKKDTEKNPNTKNTITIWIWKIDEEKVREWWIKEQARKIIQIK